MPRPLHLTLSVRPTLLGVFSQTWRKSWANKSFVLYERSNCSVHRRLQRPHLTVKMDAESTTEGLQRLASVSIRIGIGAKIGRFVVR